MNTKINYKAPIPYFICITAYMFAAIVNIQVVEQVGGYVAKTHITYRKLFDETKPFRRHPILR